MKAKRLLLALGVSLLLFCALSFFSFAETVTVSVDLPQNVIQALVDDSVLHYTDLQQYGVETGSGAPWPAKYFYFNVTSGNKNSYVSIRLPFDDISCSELSIQTEWLFLSSLNSVPYSGTAELTTTSGVLTDGYSFSRDFLNNSTVSITTQGGTFSMYHFGADMDFSASSEFVPSYLQFRSVGGSYFDTWNPSRVVFGVSRLTITYSYEEGGGGAGDIDSVTWLRLIYERLGYIEEAISRNEVSSFLDAPQEWIAQLQAEREAAESEADRLESLIAEARVTLPEYEAPDLENLELYNTALIAGSFDVLFDSMEFLLPLLLVTIGLCIGSYLLYGKKGD